MITPEIISYIQNQRTLGKTDTTIRQALISAGWQETDINTAFAQNSGIDLPLATKEPAYAGFWLRFCAYIIDQLIVAAGSFVLGFIIGFIGAFIVSPQTISNNANAIGAPIGFAAGWLYYTLLESSARQATVGKMAMKIKVTDLEGNRISWAKANARLFSKLISVIIIFIGFIMAGFTAKKQALHDIIARTLVVRV